MMYRTAVLIIVAALCSSVTVRVQLSQAAITHPVSATIKWRDALKQKPEWYGSREAVRIADNLLLYQRDTGGWYKNIDMAVVLTQEQKNHLIKQKREEESKICHG